MNRRVGRVLAVRARPVVRVLAVFVAAIAVWFGGGARGVGQLADTLDEARARYEGASYEEALAMLDRLRASLPASATWVRREVEATRALCLIALGRQADARAAMEALVEVDPLFTFGDSEASPRVRALFEEARARRLPEVVRRRYDAAKEAFDRRDYVEAAARFELVRLLLEFPALADAGADQTLRDLRTLVAGFHELSVKSLPPTVPVAAGDTLPSGDRPVALTGQGAVPGPTATAGPGTGAGTPVSGSPAGASQTLPTGSAGIRRPVVVPPEALDQRPPPWSPSLGLADGRRYHATVEVVIDETGRVVSARIIDSVSRAYDTSLLETVQRWRYRPGTRDGVPVRFTKVVTVTIEARE
jgi:TonB family protein